ncbi:MAG: methylenetetrahydrofolate reductase [Woeseiaceae bacterium]
MHTLRQTLDSGHFAITAELSPPREPELDSLTVAAEVLKPVVSAINLTDGAGARVRMSNLAAAIHLRRLGVEPVLQMACRDRNRIAMRGDLVAAAAFGIENVLALSGDGVDTGDQPAAKPVFDLDSLALLKMIRDFPEPPPAPSNGFFRGAVDAPFDATADWQPEALRIKLEAGAQFIQSQYCFDMAVLERYMRRLAEHGLTEQLYFLVGLGPLRSANAARWMRDRLPGTIMPEGVIRRMEAARDPRHEGITLCAEMIQQARDIRGVAGVHLMAPGQFREIAEVVRLAGQL